MCCKSQIYFLCTKKAFFKDSQQGSRFYRQLSGSAGSQQSCLKQNGVR